MHKKHLCTVINSSWHGGLCADYIKDVRLAKAKALGQALLLQSRGLAILYIGPNPTPLPPLQSWWQHKFFLLLLNILRCFSICCVVSKIASQKDVLFVMLVNTVSFYWRELAMQTHHLHLLQASSCYREKGTGCEITALRLRKFNDTY